MHAILKYLPYLAAAAVLLGLAFAFYIGVVSYREESADYIRTPPAEISRHPERTGISGLEEISILRPDGVRLAGWYAPPGATRAVVILVHGVGADRASLLYESRVLAQAGFGVLALDLPGQGLSGGKIEWGVPEREAISAAVDWLSHRDEVDPQRIGAYGLSMGSYVLAQAAVIDPRISAVVLASTPSEVVEFNWQASRSFGWLSQYPTYWALRAAGTPLDLAPRDILGRIAPRPLLLIQGQLDSLVPEWMAHQLFAVAHEPKELYVVAGAHHSDFSMAAPSEYRARLTDFFRRALAPVDQRAR